jgi:hypothetical protein
MAGDAPYTRFMRFSDWLYARTGKTHEIALDRLFELVHEFLIDELAVAADIASRALLEDYQASGARGRLSFMPENAPRTAPVTSKRGLRQVRHLQPQTTT